MIELDIALVREAERLTNGADIHKTRGLLAMYQARVKDVQQKPTPQNVRALEIFYDGLKDHVCKMRIQRARQTRLLG